VIRRGPKAIEIYNECMRNDQDIEWAAMCALQQPPGTARTDRAYQQTAFADFAGWPPGLRKAALQVAKEAGINTNGKVYEGTLGRYDDPAAWVGSIDDISASCKAKGMDIDGVVKIRGNQRPKGEQKKIALSEEIIKEKVGDELKKPEVRSRVKAGKLKIGELREAVVDRHSPG